MPAMGPALVTEHPHVDGLMPRVRARALPEPVRINYRIQVNT